MKVVHVSHTDIKGGAARAGYGIFKSLESIDIQAKMLVQRKFSNDQNVVAFSNSWISDKLIKKRIYFDLLPMYLYTNRHLGRFSFAKEGVDISKNKVIQDADLIHFHWINEGFLSLNSIYQLSNLNKPVIWTLHDMWPFTGGCHYANDCNNYQIMCNNCPYLRNSSPNDFSYKIWSKKKKIFNDLNTKNNNPK